MEKDEEEEVVENIKNNNIKRKKERKKETSRPMWSVQEQEGTKGLKDFDSELTSHETRPLMRSGGAPLQIFARMRNPVRKVFFFHFPAGRWRSVASPIASRPAPGAGPWALAVQDRLRYARHLAFSRASINPSLNISFFFSY